MKKLDFHTFHSEAAPGPCIASYDGHGGRLFDDKKALDGMLKA